MKRATKIIGTATVIGLLAIPVAQSSDWMLPALWDWVVNVGYPKITEHDARLNAVEAEETVLEARISSLESGDSGRISLADMLARIEELEVELASNSSSPSAAVLDVNGDIVGVLAPTNRQSTSGTTVLFSFSLGEAILDLSPDGLHSFERFIWYAGGLPYSDDSYTFDPLGYVDGSGQVWRRSAEAGVTEIRATTRCDLIGDYCQSYSSTRSLVPYVIVGHIDELTGPFSISLE